MNEFSPEVEVGDFEGSNFSDAKSRERGHLPARQLKKAKNEAKKMLFDATIASVSETARAVGSRLRKSMRSIVWPMLKVCWFSLKWRAGVPR